MSEGTIFETCTADYPDTATQLSELLKCVSDKQTERSDSIGTGLDAFFLIFAGAMVFFMQTGFAMLCAGSIRAKNVKNVILWNLLDSCGGGICFWAVGYAFAYGGDADAGGKTFVGTQGFFLQGDPGIRFENFLFQWAFACAVSSIVAGTVAERMQMKAYLLYSSILAAFVYPVVAHAFWSSHGFLSNAAADPLWGCGIVDLAGSGPVHMLGGVCALVAAIILGPRMGRFHDKDGNLLDEPNDIPPHSVTLQMLGTFCLWFGWYGFNPGSVLFISNSNSGEVAALVAVNTTLSACSGAITALFLSTAFDYYYYGYHTYDVTYTMNGCLTGLVAITSPAASVETWAAVLIGMGAGAAYLIGSKLMIRFRIDDAVDAVPVHMFGGAWGVIAAGLFSKPELLAMAYGDMGGNAGWFYEWSEGSGDFTLIGTQLIGVLFIFSWGTIVMGAFFAALNFLGWFRIDPLEEEVGMDVSRHKGAAYDIQGANADDVKQLENARMSISDDRSGRGKKLEETVPNGGAVLEEENPNEIEA